MMKKEKYEDNGKPYRKRIPKKDIKQAAKVYGEDSELLTYLLEICMKNGIKTHACCRGHLKDDGSTVTPYISFFDQPGVTDYLISKISESPSLQSISIARDMVGNSQMTKNLKVAFYSSYGDREDFFRSLIDNVSDYVAMHGPVEQRGVKGIFKGMSGKRFKGEIPNEKTTIRKILDNMYLSNSIRMAAYNAKIQVYYLFKPHISEPVSLVEKNVDSYLSTLSSENIQHSENSVISAIKNFCRSANIGINQISQAGRNLQGKSKPQVHKDQKQNTEQFEK